MFHPANLRQLQFDSESLGEDCVIRTQGAFFPLLLLSLDIHLAVSIGQTCVLSALREIDLN